jgi:hypothetical protein
MGIYNEGILLYLLDLAVADTVLGGYRSRSIR